MNRAMGSHRLRSWFAVLACLGLMFLFALADAAWASRPLTLDEQAHINVIRKYRPDIADKFEKQLRKLENQLENRPALTDEQKNQARQNVLDKQLEAARTAMEAANNLGTDQQKEEATRVFLTVLSFKYVYLKQYDGPRSPKR